MPALRYDSPLQYVKGVGPRRAEALAELGLLCVRDLLFYFPRHYLDRTSIVPIGSLQLNQVVTIIGQVRAHGLLHGRRRRYEVILEDDTGGVSLVWFQGIRFWEKLFKKGMIFAATGRVGFFMGTQIVHPELERLEDESDQLIHAGRIIPVYPQTAELNAIGLNSRTIRSLTSYIFDNLNDRLSDHLLPEFLKQIPLLEINEALARIHFPESREAAEAARRRFAFDELLVFQFLAYRNKLRKQRQVKPHRYQPPGDRYRQFAAALPFQLTTAQEKAAVEIVSDLQGIHPAARLLQGDVGSGKTVVAVLAALFAAENNLQVAFMAPTEILADQHFRNWQKPLQAVGVRSELITSSRKAATRKAVTEAAAAGEIDILFGTHALLYDSVTLPRLGLVIIDEQHRFGVEQRGLLMHKGENPDLLVMTATPIPRTLALTLYGDLDVTSLNELPPGRKPIRSAWRAADVRDKVYEFVRGEIAAGGKAYVIFPLIEKSEQLDLLNLEEAFEELQARQLRGLRLAVVHGRIKAAERDETLSQFRQGEVDVLLATTVIEVGLDNPNASVMVIEHAERFGLSQLHQLRGRIGRGSRQATVVALAYEPMSETARQRLEYFAGTTDGFAIAEADLELRGPGELFGLRQSGAPLFRTVRLSDDRDLLEAARRLLESLPAANINLDSPEGRLYSYLDEQAGRHTLHVEGG